MTANRQKQVDRFFLSAKLGAGAWALSLSLYLVLIMQGMDQAPGWAQVNYALLIFCFAALIVQFRNRNADEFTAQAWSGASNVAFLLTVGWMVFAIQAEWWISYIIWQVTGTAVQTGYSYWWAFQMPFTAFYAVFWFRQWRG